MSIFFKTVVVQQVSILSLLYLQKTASMPIHDTNIDQQSLHPKPQV